MVENFAPIARPIIVTAVAACVFACLDAPALSQTGAIMIPIETMLSGAPPPEFEFARTGQGAAGTWIVVEDPTASGARAIEQASVDRTDFRFPLAIYRAVTAKNVEVTLRFKPLAGKVDRPAASPCASPRRMTITSCAPMRWRTTSASIAS